MTLFSAAVVQCVSDYLDPVANARRTVSRIADASQSGARLIVLPELVSTSYAPTAVGLMDVAESVSDPGPCLSAWQSAAKDHGVVIVAGFTERVKDSLFNSAVVIDESGAIRDVYRKLHLFGAEHEAFQPGNRGLPIVEVLGTRLGVAVCYDLRFPETLRILALRGCEVVAVPTAWVRGFDRKAVDSGRIGQVDGAVVQANLNQLFLVIADQVGSIESTEFLGRSLIVDPYGQELLPVMSAQSEGIGLAQIDTGLVETARHRGPGIDPLVNRRTDVYAEDLGYHHPKGELAR